MHKHFLLALAWMVLTGGFSFAQQGADLSQHVYFKHLIGKWEGGGDLTGADGNPVKVTEEWTGKATPEGGFIIEGKRELNETKQTFKWTVTRNAATDNFTAVMVNDGDEAGALRFEVNVSEVNLTAEMKAPIGSNGSITLLDSFPTEDKKTLSSKVTLLGDSGETNLSGTITFKRVQEP